MLGASGMRFSLLGLLAAAAPRDDGPRVVLYNDQWSLYGRQFSVYDLDDTVLSRDMPYSNLYLMHAFLYADPSTCYLHTTDRWGDFGWAMFEDSPGVYDTRGRSQATYTGTRGWFGFYNFLRSRYTDRKLHIIPSIGGWSMSFSLQYCTQQKADVFLGTLMEHVKFWNWDGVDIDWEYPSCAESCGCQGEYICSAAKHNGQDTSNKSSPGDWAKYAVFLKTLKDNLNSKASSMGKDKLTLSLALGMSPDLLTGGTSAHPDPTPIEWMCDNDTLDFVNMMTYDFFGTFLRKTGPLAPLYDSEFSEDDDEFNLHYSISNVLARCTKPEKLNMGLATYSKAWRKVPTTGDVPGYFQNSSETVAGDTNTSVGWQCTGSLDLADMATNTAAPKTGTVPWFELVGQWFKGCTRTWAPGSEIPTLYCAKSPILADDTDVFIAYEDPESWYYKMAYAKRAGLGGAIIWTSGDFGSTKQMEKYGNKDIGKPMWRSIYQGWFQDLSIDIGGASKTGSDPGPSWKYLGSSDSACNGDQPNCSCPLEPEQRAGMYNSCAKPLTATISCPNCSSATEPPSGNAPASPAMPPEDCKRPTDQVDPADYWDPLASYTKMGCGGGSSNDSTEPTTTENTSTTTTTPTNPATSSSVTTTTTPSNASTTTSADDDDDEQEQCLDKGCTWECS